MAKKTSEYSTTCPQCGKDHPFLKGHFCSTECTNDAILGKEPKKANDPKEDAWIFERLCESDAGLADSVSPQLAARIVRAWQTFEAKRREHLKTATAGFES